MLTLKEIKPNDPNYHEPLDELIEDLGHARPSLTYGDVVITVEDGIQQGGLFSAVSEFFAKNIYPHPIFPVAVDGRFVEHGDMDSLYRELHFDTESLVEKVRSVWSNLNK